jgi:hypothetical protein
MSKQIAEFGPGDAYHRCCLNASYRNPILSSAAHRGDDEASLHAGIIHLSFVRRKLGPLAQPSTSRRCVVAPRCYGTPHEPCTEGKAPRLHCGFRPHRDCGAMIDPLRAPAVRESEWTLTGSPMSIEKDTAYRSGV